MTDVTLEMVAQCIESLGVEQTVIDWITDHFADIALPGDKQLLTTLSLFAHTLPVLHPAYVAYTLGTSLYIPELILLDPMPWNNFVHHGLHHHLDATSLLSKSVISDLLLEKVVQRQIGPYLLGWFASKVAHTPQHKSAF